MILPRPARLWATLVVGGLGFALGLALFGGGPSQPAARRRGGSCASDADCQSQLCEVRTDGLGRRCADRACAPCERVDEQGECRPVHDATTLLCAGRCGDSQGELRCCDGACTCRPECG